MLALAVAAGGCNTADLKGPRPGESSGDVGPWGAVGDDGGARTDGGRDPVADLESLPATSAVKMQMQPSDSGKALLELIRGAQSSVHMTMYLLSDNAVIDALGDLKAAGKDVKVVLNQKFPANAGSNQDAYTKLQQRGVEVRWAPAGYPYTHAKSLIVDGRQVVIMTMNLTFTSPRSNREFIAIDSDPDDVADAEKLFDADFAGQTTAVGGKLVVSPESASPINARERLKALIDSAQTSLDVESQSLSDVGIVDAIVAAHEANVQVRIVVSGVFEPSDAQKTAVARLKQHGVPIVSVNEPYIHAKAIVADGKLAFVGSQNLTSNALFNNREIGVITDAPPAVQLVRETIAKDFANGSPL
jgi:cardiolipin synthase A/B